MTPMKYSKIKKGLNSPQNAIKYIWRKNFNQYVVTLLNNIYKNDSKLVLFGSRYGTAYDGNSRVMFEWFLDQVPEMKPVWMTRNDRVYTQLSKENKPVVNIDSIEGSQVLGCASVGAITHNHTDITTSKGAIHNNLQIIHLRNAAGIMWDKEYMKKAEKMEKAISYRNKWDVIISNSSREVELERKRVPCSKDKYKITGFPRNDLILESSDEKHSESDLSLEKYEHIFLYAPTKRKPLEIESEFNDVVKFFPFNDHTYYRLEQLLQENNTAILLRPHPTTTERINSGYSDQYRELEQFLCKLCAVEGIELADHERYPSVGQLLKSVHGLITDYSGILLDFLLTESPVMFIPYDYEKWREHIGFVIEDYHSLPGPTVCNFEQFQTELKNLTNNNDEYRKQRKEFSNRYYTHRDGDARKRVAQIIKEMSYKESEGSG